MSLKKKQISASDEANRTKNKLFTPAQLLECQLGWDDLVIPEFLKNSLQNFEFEAKEQKQFFPQGKGLIGLFSGPPGTGKTMASQVIAAELGLDLYRIDLSSIINKYVGETSKNLERILSIAANMDIVLLFDEADSLFGKHAEAQDSHDKIGTTDTNYLLQSIENYKGIAILKCSKLENIDTAFIRRLRYVLEFPRPDSSQRENIWHNNLAKLVNKKNLPNLDKQINILANHIELTGGQIKLAVIKSVSAAKRDKKQINITHLLQGVDWELKNEGKPLSALEKAKLINRMKK